MKFYMQLSDRFSHIYRLQNDKITWRNIERNKALCETDYLSSNIYELFKLQEIDSTIELDGKLWQLNLTEVHYGKFEYLSYQIFVKRSIFPQIPSYEQLVSVIRQGDDRYHNTLILNVYGFFELRDFNTINISVEDPTIVVRNETFTSGNEYVGNDAADDKNFMNNIYKTSLENWLIHIKTGTTNIYSDDFTTRDLKDILSEIEKCRIDFPTN